MMKSNPAEKPGIAENKGLPRLLQNEVIVFFGPESGWLGPQFSGHTKMNPNPIPAGKFEKHLFTFSERTQEAAAGELPRQLPRVRSAKNSFPRMELYRDDFFPEAAVPLLSIKLHFGEFGHRAKCCSRLALSRRGRVGRTPRSKRRQSAVATARRFSIMQSPC